MLDHSYQRKGGQKRSLLYDLNDFLPPSRENYHSYCHYPLAMAFRVAGGKMLKFSNNHEKTNGFVTLMHTEVSSMLICSK